MHDPAVGFDPHDLEPDRREQLADARRHVAELGDERVAGEAEVRTAAEIQAIGRGVDAEPGGRLGGGFGVLGEERTWGRRRRGAEVVRVLGQGLAGEVVGPAVPLGRLARLIAQSRSPVPQTGRLPRTSKLFSVTYSVPSGAKARPKGLRRPRRRAQRGTPTATAPPPAGAVAGPSAARGADPDAHHGTVAGELSLHGLAGLGRRAGGDVKRR